MTKLKIGSIPEMLSVVPYLVGFHPENSMVVVGFEHIEVTVVGRIDLPELGVSEAEARLPLLHLAVWVSRCDVSRVAIIGYGEGARATPALERLAAGLGRIGVDVDEMLRVENGRYWSYMCDNLVCCPVEGKPCPPLNSVLAAEATFAGAVALPSRKHLEDQVRSVRGDQRKAMDEASARAKSRLRSLGVEAARSVRPARQQRRLPTAFEVSRRTKQLTMKAGRMAVREAEGRYRMGGRLTDDEAAWLLLLLDHRSIRDYAWTRMGTANWCLALWSDLVRRASSAHAAAPASLLAFIAWRMNEGTLATIAIDRALQANPEYQMAEMMREIVSSAVPPSAVDGWPAPPGFEEAPRKKRSKLKARRRI